MVSSTCETDPLERWTPVTASVAVDVAVAGAGAMVPPGSVFVLSDLALNGSLPAGDGPVEGAVAVGVRVASVGDFRVTAPHPSP